MASLEPPQSSSPPRAGPGQEPGGLRALLARDLPASLVVFLVALPLSLGIALASNAPPLAGIVAGVTGGVVVGALGGAPLQVAGPAAGLTAVVFGLVERCHGDWRAVTALVVLAGALQVALGALRVARWALAISPAVVHGMLAGIGCLIALGQLQVVLGGAPRGSALGNLSVLPGHLAGANPGAALLGGAAFALVLLWPRGPRARLARVPAPLVAVALLTLASLPLGASVERLQLAPGGAGAGLREALQLPRWPDLPPREVLGAVLALALIASVESLLCAVATDRLHRGPRARLDRELMAQGAGNVVSGLLGGLPVTGVIVRSKANIDAGAATRASAILHGVWLLVFVAALAPLVEQIPRAVLAGLLVTVGVRLVDVRHIRASLAHGEGLPYFATLGGILLEDLLFGVALGFVVGAVTLLHRLTRLSVEVSGPPGGPLRVVVAGALTFRSVPELTRRLAQVPAGAPVCVDLDLRFMDQAGWEALHGWQVGHERTGGAVALDGLDAAWQRNPAAPPGPALEPAPAREVARA